MGERGAARVYSRNCQTCTASPAEPGELPWLLGQSEKAAAAVQEMLRIEPQFTLSNYSASLRVLADTPWGGRLLEALRLAGFPE